MHTNRSGSEIVKRSEFTMVAAVGSKCLVADFCRLAVNV